MVLQASGVQMQLQVASPKVRENLGPGSCAEVGSTGCIETGGGRPSKD